MTVPHLPGQASERVQAEVEDGPFEVEGLEHIEFTRRNWTYMLGGRQINGGGYQTFAVCRWCGEDVVAGGGQGERNVIRWGLTHNCSKANQPVYQVDEDQKPFGV